MEAHWTNCKWYKHSFEEFQSATLNQNSIIESNSLTNFLYSPVTPAYERLRELLSSGVIGDLVHIHACYADDIPLDRVVNKKFGGGKLNFLLNFQVESSQDLQNVNQKQLCERIKIFLKLSSNRVNRNRVGHWRLRIECYPYSRQLSASNQGKGCGQPLP